MTSIGLLEAAVHRPRTSVWGSDAYALVDGDKCLAWLATYVFLAKNGVELTPDDDAAYDFMIAVAAGSLDDVDPIADVLRTFV